MASFADLPSRALIPRCPAAPALSSRWLVIAAVASSLSACGGGGGSAPAPEPPPPPAPAPSPSPLPTAPIAAQMTVPAPVGYDADRLAAFNRLNEVRLSAGLGMVAQQPQMDQAAQAHAEWMIANDAFTHDEVEGTPGFTGINWPRRDEAFGYVPVGGGEVISAPVHGEPGVDYLINTVYHRAVLLAFEPVDVGVGWSGSAALDVSMPLVIDVTKPGTDTTRGLGQAAQPDIHGVAIWPLNGAQGVPLSLGLESPDPVPSQDVSTLGTPASLTVAAAKTIYASSFVMTNTATGAVVPAQLLTNQNDPNDVMPESFIALIPLVVLSANTTYAVSFSGHTVEFPSGANEHVDKAWSFTTAAR
jgi:hypothetical protein